MKTFFAALLLIMAPVAAMAEKFSVEITDTETLASISSAREAWNERCSPVRGDGCKIETDEAFMQKMIESTVASWEREFSPKVKAARAALEKAQREVVQKREPPAPEPVPIPSPNPRPQRGGN